MRKDRRAKLNVLSDSFIEQCSKILETIEPYEPEDSERTTSEGSQS